MAKKKKKRRSKHRKKSRARRRIVRRRVRKPRRKKNVRRKKPVRRKAKRRARTKRRSKKRRRAARRRKRRVAKRRSARVPRRWAELPNERLLDLRIADLPLRTAGTELTERLHSLYDELKQRGLPFRPHAWLSDEWFSPDGIPGIGIPFYLAHPRLKRLERDMMLEVEGASRTECMKLLRHEAAHALLNAYQLHRRRDWQQHFGRSSQRYPDNYVPRPYSKRFVQHLPNWYAQSHPHEDWAETFAVWLTPGSDWRKRYRDWPALKKLEYVDQLMQEIRIKPALLRNHREALPLRELKLTLREYYETKQKRYGKDKVEFTDVDLSRLFSNDESHKHNEKASTYLRRRRDEIAEIVSGWTGEYNYRIDEVMKGMIARCDELDLRVARPDAIMETELAACLTMLVTTKLHTGGFRITV